MGCFNISSIFYDILVFAPPDEPDTVYIKRGIGLPGETVVVSSGSVFADGVRLDDSFVKNPMSTKGMALMWYRRAAISLMGDNRNQSNDSKFWTEKYRGCIDDRGKQDKNGCPFCIHIMWKKQAI